MLLCIQKYQKLCNRRLRCEQEKANPNDKFAVKLVFVIGNEEKCVGHVPIEQSKIFNFFLKRGGKAITSDSDDGLDINELQHNAKKAATENILSMRNCNASTKTESDKIENNIQRTNLPSNTMSNSTNSASKLTPQLINATSGPCTQAQTSA
ncbi:Hypothetical predicted protein [Mytilus galloprovincialis]|uniref:Uncharacterized protein n=1 Tax=Mytilus galloprovincialis TaxID=29158 RepID=A0A8B6GUA0_MYTGA|nr:Hypothetical predicted protein [Mytilus galloprovincialis]